MCLELSIIANEYEQDYNHRRDSHHTLYYLGKGEFRTASRKSTKISEEEESSCINLCLLCYCTSGWGAPWVRLLCVIVRTNLVSAFVNLYMQS